MKNLKSQSRIALTALAAVSIFTACNKTSFAPVQAETELKSEIPIDNPPVVIPIIPTPGPVSKTFSLSSGACASDSSTQVLSCLKCVVPQIKPVPQLSAKGQALLDAMTLVCNISNKSDRNNFRPTHDMILNKLNQASELNYPETARTAQMSLVIQGLTNPADSSLRQRMFGGLWYQPPYSDAFETYFGITSEEAKSTFCWNGDKMNGIITDQVGLYSIEWLRCQYSGNPYSCVEKPNYVLAQGYRKQLQKTLALGVSNPYSAPTPDPAKKCTWDKFTGDDLIAAKEQLKRWKAAGRKVGMNVNRNGIGLCGDASEAGIPEGSTVELATYKCE